MLSRSIVLGLVVIAFAVSGCNSSNDTGKSAANGSAPAAATAAASPAAASLPAASAQDAKIIVAGFLEAIRKGDDEKAKRFLTKIARQKADETGRCVTPPANDNAKIEVSDPTFPTPAHDIVHVPTVWIDLDESGKPRPEKATWVCRLEPEGWRVAGFAAYVFDGEDPLLLSFEDPEDMQKKQLWLKEELDRRSKPADPAPVAGSGSPTQAENKPQDAFRR
jgi:hypothetical protein